MDERLRMLFRAAFNGLVAEHAATGRFDRDRAAQNLKAYAGACAAAGVPVELPAGFAELVARDLAGEVDRRGRPPAVSWQARRRAVQRFYERRAAGEKYEAALEVVSREVNVSRQTLESWLSLENRT